MHFPIKVHKHKTFIRNIQTVFSGYSYSSHDCNNSSIWWPSSRRATVNNHFFLPLAQYSRSHSSIFQKPKPDIKVEEKRY